MKFNKKSEIKQLYIWITLGIIVLAVYIPVLSNAFLLFWNDNWMVMNSYTFDGFTPDNLRKILTDPYNGQYSPVNQIYYLLLYSVSGLDSFTFHLGSLLLHFANVMLVYHLLFKILMLSSNFNGKESNCLAFFTALLFAIYPLNAESVSWISASKVLLFTLFYLLSLLAYIQYVSRKKLKYYFFSICFFILSFGSKEQAITVIFSVILLDYVLRRNLKDKRVWIEKVPFALLSILFLAITLCMQGDVFSDTGGSYSFFERFVLIFYSFMEYITKCIFPIDIPFLYPYQTGGTVPAYFWAYPVIVIIFLILFFTEFKIKKHRHLYFVLLFFVINLGINSLPRFNVLADCHIYITIPAVFLFTGIFFLNIIKKYRKYRILLFAGLMTYIIILGIYSHQQTKTWRDSDSLKNTLQIYQINKYYDR
ncbi:MAG: hypothetical protein LBG80_05695 [Bacteroidales bacterium]|jgi:hypothetical protein|nr:hypothetical protein [Bacteroidales bacterium]